jgi:excisionase family DNA binding protein
MRIEEVLEKFVDYKGDLSKDLSRLEPNEVNEIISKLKDFGNKLENIKEDKKRKIYSDKPEFLTVVDAAEILHVSPATIYAWVKSGKIKSHRFGATVRFTHDDLMSFIQSKITIDSSQVLFCTKSKIWFDKKTFEILPFEEGELYDIVDANHNYVYLSNKKWNMIVRLCRKEYKEHFRLASKLEIDAEIYKV